MERQRFIKNQKFFSEKTVPDTNVELYVEQTVLYKKVEFYSENTVFNTRSTAL